MPTPNVSLLYVYVADLERTAAFYTGVIGLQLGLDDEGGPGSEHYEGWWPPAPECERSHLYLAFWTATDENPPTRITWGFSTDDLDALHARALAAGATVKSPPAKGYYGRGASYFDPDGNTVSVGETVTS